MHGLPPDYLSSTTAKIIAARIGDWSFDNCDEITSWTKFIRVRVTIDITKPLVSSLKIKLLNGDDTLVTIRYERLARMCTFCGMIGHEYVDRKNRLSFASKIKLEYPPTLHEKLLALLQPKFTDLNALSIHRTTSSDKGGHTLRISRQTSSLPSFSSTGSPSIQTSALNDAGCTSPETDQHMLWKAKDLGEQLHEQEINISKKLLGQAVQVQNSPIPFTDDGTLVSVPVQVTPTLLISNVQDSLEGMHKLENIELCKMLLYLNFSSR